MITYTCDHCHRNDSKCKRATLKTGPMQTTQVGADSVEAAVDLCPFCISTIKEALTEKLPIVEAA